MPANSMYASSTTTSSASRQQPIQLVVRQAVARSGCSARRGRSASRCGAAFSIASMSSAKLSSRGTSMTRPPAISVENGYMPNVGGQLMTPSPGSDHRAQHQVDQVVAAEPADDAARRQRRRSRERLAHLRADPDPGRCGTRARRAIACERLRRRTVRILVAVELQHVGRRDAEAPRQHVGRLDRQ